MAVFRMVVAKVKRKLYAASDYWTCARCGTTNPKHYSNCKQCKNRRPY